MLLRSKAFSLFELVITFSVLLLLMSVAVMPLRQLISSHQEKLFFNQLLYDIDKMRDVTRLDHSDRQIDFMEDYYQIKTDGQAVLKKYYPKSLKLSSGTTMAFAVTGVPKKSGTTTFYNKNKKTYQIILAPVTGRVRLEVQ